MTFVLGAGFAWFCCVTFMFEIPHHGNEAERLVAFAEGSGVFVLGLFLLLVFGVVLS